MCTSGNWLIINLGVGVCVAGFVGCATPGSSAGGQISKAPFGTTNGGLPVDIYTLRNAQGVEARIMNLERV